MWRAAKQYSEQKALTTPTPHSYASDEDFELPGIDCELRFAGQWEDEESGLHFNLNRYYDPGSGQYLSQDPIGLEGGLRTQGYVSDPLTWVDPLGLAGCSGLGKVTSSHSAIKPGPLADDLAGTFAGGRYKVVTLKKDTVLYRAGVSDKPLGQFFSKERPVSVRQTRIDKAVLPEWPGGGKSPLDTGFGVKIPAGTQVYVGEVGSQGGVYVGGTQQVVVVKPWTIKGVEVTESYPLAK